MKKQGAKNVMKSLTVRTVCRDMWSMLMQLHTPRLAIIVTKSFSVWIVCRDMWQMFMKIRKPCMKIKPKQAQCKSGHSWFGKTKAQDPQQPGASFISNLNTTSHQETPSPHCGPAHSTIISGGTTP